MNGSIEQIYHAAAHGQPQHLIDAARLVNGRGLEGDRYFGSTGGVVSLIEAEAVAAFNAETGLNIDPGATGRNIVTSGIRLNPLVGKAFTIGDVALEGFELCEPCASLGQNLATANVSAARIVKTFLVSAGLRAYVRGTGVIRPGDPISARSD